MFVELLQRNEFALDTECLFGVELVELVLCHKGARDVYIHAESIKYEGGGFEGSGVTAKGDSNGLRQISAYGQTLSFLCCPELAELWAW